MCHSGPDIAVLITRARANATRLGELLRRYHGFLWLMAQQRLGGRISARCDPDDVVQQTLIEATQSFAAFAGTNEAEFSAWLKQIHLRNIHDALRRHLAAQSRSVRRERPLLDPEGSASLFWHELAADQSTPSQRLIRAENALFLADLLHALPDGQREAVRLRHLEGWTIEQIATHLGRSVPATAGLLKRGLQALRGRLPEGRSDP